MNKPNTPADSATRVKAFRERLAGSSYRRVEAYVTTDEKAQLDSVKQELGVTGDVAVAGLLRIGLEAYANSRKPPIAGAQAASLSSSPALQALNFCGSLAEPSFQCAANSAQPLVMPAAAAPDADNNPPNPIAQFFKSRKETKHE